MVAEKRFMIPVLQSAVKSRCFSVPYTLMHSIIEMKRFHCQIHETVKIINQVSYPN